MRDPFFTSLTRIAPFQRLGTSSIPLGRAQWATGDYVLAEIRDQPSGAHLIESPSGRQVEVLPGDLIVGALGRRHATLAAVGDWRAVGDDLLMDALTVSGVLGRCTSCTLPPPPMAPLRYLGHVTVDGARQAMGDYVAPMEPRRLEAPIVLMIGTSMEAGKTTAAKRIVRALKARGLRVGGAKLTGVGRYRDILGMRDAGADFVLDFVDAGLPSTACPPDEFEPALRLLLARLAHEGVDVVVAEAGASPLEPYNGDVAVRSLGDNIAMTVLCATDPYAVVGVMDAFGTLPDLVAGRAASTDAGIELIERLCGVKALNMLDPRSMPELEAILETRLRLAAPTGA